jgi:hypothetical protein
MDGSRTAARFGFLHIFTRGKPAAGNSYLWPSQPWLTSVYAQAYRCVRFGLQPA